MCVITVRCSYFGYRWYGRWSLYIPKTLMSFSASFGHFSGERGGGLPDSKDDEEHFCFYLDIFQVKFGGITKVQTL